MFFSPSTCPSLKISFKYQSASILVTKPVLRIVKLFCLKMFSEIHDSKVKSFAVFFLILSLKSPCVNMNTPTKKTQHHET